VPFWGKFSHNFHLNILIFTNFTKGFCSKIGINFINKKLKLSNFHNRFQQDVKIYLFIYLFHIWLVYGQIWLNLLMDDQQFGYIIKSGDFFIFFEKNENSNTPLCM
jgi:hypothetical protein